MELDADARAMLLRIAREAIRSEVMGDPMAHEPAYPPPLQQQAGVFVTIHEHGDLRGCIGTLQSTLPLYHATEDAARSAAVRDPRFPRLSPAELERIDLEISVLSPFEPVRDTSTIMPGRDGLLIRRGYHSGLLLPQVATEQGWDREAFLGNTCRKAGLPTDAWRDGSCQIERFTATVFSE